MQSIVLLEHPSRAREALQSSFEACGFEVIATDCVEAALAATRDRSVRAAIIEAMLNGVSALPAIPRFKEAHAGVPVAVCTTHGSIRNVVHAMRAGAASFMIKPVTADQVLAEIGGHQPVDEGIEHPSYHRAVWEYVTQCRELAGSLAEASRWLGLDRRSLRRMLQKMPPVR